MINDCIINIIINVLFFLINNTIFLYFSNYIIILI